MEAHVTTEVTGVILTLEMSEAKTVLMALGHLYKSSGWTINDTTRYIITGNMYDQLKELLDG